MLDFAVIAQAVDLSKYNYLELPGTDVWGVVMRKDALLAQKEAVYIDDLLDLPLIVSRQGFREDITLANKDRKGDGGGRSWRHKQGDVVISA